MTGARGSRRDQSVVAGDRLLRSDLVDRDQWSESEQVQRRRRGRLHGRL